MMNEETLRKNILENNLITEDEKIVLATTLEEAFIGVGRQFSRDPIAVYDREKCIQILMKDGMDEGEAEEYFEYNVQGAWVGEQTPIFISKL